MLNTHDNQTYPPHSIRTFTGKVFDIINPTLEMINIRDIAHALSLQCRFSGQTSRHLSIAEHSIGVADRLPYELKLAGLLHDASEAYLVDIPTPIKGLMPQYYTLEENLMNLIYTRFSVPDHANPLIHQCDKDALQHEWDMYMVECISKPGVCTHQYWEMLFLEIFHELTKNRYSTPDTSYGNSIIQAEIKREAKLRTKIRRLS